MIDLSGHSHLFVGMLKLMCIMILVWHPMRFSTDEIFVLSCYERSVETRDDYCSNYPLFVGVHAERSLVLLSFAFCVFLPCLLFSITNLT